MIAITLPIRIKLSRGKGFDLQKISRAYNGLPAVNCARPGRYGNIFVVSEKKKPGTSGLGYVCVPTIEDAVECHRIWLEERMKLDAEFVAELAKLAGSNLACWCKHGWRCHVDNLLLGAQRAAIILAQQK